MDGQACCLTKALSAFLLLAYSAFAVVMQEKHNVEMKSLGQKLFLVVQWWGDGIRAFFFVLFYKMIERGYFAFEDRRLFLDTLQRSIAKDQLTMELEGVTTQPCNDHQQGANQGDKLTGSYLH